MFFGDFSFSARVSNFMLGETFGYIIRKGLAKPETVFDLAGLGMLGVWNRFSRYIYYRRSLSLGTLGRDHMKNYEYFAQEMQKINDSRKQVKEETKLILKNA